jgi:hypothetical protein
LIFEAWLRAAQGSADAEGDVRTNPSPVQDYPVHSRPGSCELYVRMINGISRRVAFW